jgi:hypothetical protein
MQAHLVGPNRGHSCMISLQRLQRSNNPIKKNYLWVSDHELYCILAICKTRWIISKFCVFQRIQVCEGVEIFKSIVREAWGNRAIIDVRGSWMLGIVVASSFKCYVKGDTRRRAIYRWGLTSSYMAARARSRREEDEIVEMNGNSRAEVLVYPEDGRLQSGCTRGVRNGRVCTWYW